MVHGPAPMAMPATAAKNADRMRATPLSPPARTGARLTARDANAPDNASPGWVTARSAFAPSIIVQGANPPGCLTKAATHVTTPISVF